jgi:ABC-type sugar transport system permease subunit
MVRWYVASVTAVLTFFIIGIPTAVIPNSVFGREIEVTAWSVPVLALTSILSGLLLATYIAARFGGAGAVLSYFAVGCPVCNKLALVALGYSGAIKYFAPIQPILGFLSIGLLFYVFRKRVLNEGTCVIPAK